MCSVLNSWYTIRYSTLITVLLPRDRLVSLSYFFFLYKYMQSWCIKGPLFRLSLCNIIGRRNISSYNKELYFQLEKALWGFKCLTWTGWMWTIYVSTCFHELWDRSNLWILSCYECALVYFYEISTIILE